MRLPTFCPKCQRSDHGNEKLIGERGLCLVRGVEPLLAISRIRLFLVTAPVQVTGFARADLLSNSCGICRSGGTNVGSDEGPQCNHFCTRLPLARRITAANHAEP